MRVYVREVATGEVRDFEDGVEEFSDFVWTEGNYACDCNRALFFARCLHLPDPNIPCSNGKFQVRIVDLDGTIVLDEFTS